MVTRIRDDAYLPWTLPKHLAVPAPGDGLLSVIRVGDPPVCNHVMTVRIITGWGMMDT